MIIVIGGGASGFFAAITAAETYPDATVIILEKSHKILSKVLVSGGGRCNVTNACFDLDLLVKNYPRGNKELKQVFSQFAVHETIDWFNKRGVSLKTELDGRIFPVSDNAQTIVDCFLHSAKKAGVTIRMQEEVLDLQKLNDQKIEVITSKDSLSAEAVICCMGGHSQLRNYSFLKNTGHSIEALVPSLFTFNLPESDIRKLMGVSVQKARVNVSKTPFQYSGPVLITHWGLSGPAVLKLSAYAAKEFFDSAYCAEIRINWTSDLNEEEIRKQLDKHRDSKQQIASLPLFELPKRLWEYLLEKSGAELQKPWNETPKKVLNRFSGFLGNDSYEMKGKTTFKEEFVTSGGIRRKEVDFKSMQSKLFSHLFFCGEVLDIDGITGGFNFQNAWSTAWIAGTHCLNCDD